MKWIRLAKEQEIKSSCLIMLILKCLYIHASKPKMSDKWLINKSQPRAKVETNVKQYGVIKPRLIAGMGSSNNTEEKKSVEMKRSGLLDCSSEQMWIKWNQDKRKQWKVKSRFICQSSFNASQYHLLLMECYLVKLEKKNEFHY